MHASVIYANTGGHLWIDLEIEEGTTAQQAIEQSGILERFPEITLDEQKIGIFGKVSKPNAVLKEGDRVEIYRPITVDPETVERR